MGGLTPEQIHWIAWGLLIASAVAGAFCVSLLVKSRSGTYYYQRRAALGKASRCLVAALVSLVLGIILLFAGSSPEEADGRPTPDPTPAATPLPTDIPTVTPILAPTVTPLPGITRAAPTTATPTSPPAPTPDSPLSSAVPAGEGASITFHSLALERNESGWPEQVGEEFPPGNYTLYLFFRYEGMENGVPRTFSWYRGDEELACSGTAPWEWGGRGFTHYRCPHDWTPGDYQVHVFVEQELQFTAGFAITTEE